MPFEVGHNPNRVSAMELVQKSFQDIEQRFYEVKYPDLLWNQVLPEGSIDTGINPGATITSYRVTDWRGHGQFRSKHGQNIPTVGRTLDQVNVPISVASVSGIFDTEDARQVQFGYGENMLTVLPEIMRKAAERHVEGVFFYGDTDLNFLGFIDYPTVDKSTVVNGGGGSPLWENKTPTEILFDINDAISTMICNSKNIHIPKVIYLPCDKLAYIASQLISANDSANTILSFVKKNNAATNISGVELEFRSLRYLEGAGVGATDRMVLMDTEAENFKFPFPLPFDLLDPQMVGFDVHLLSEYKFGSFHVRRPQAMLYADGI